MAVVLFANQVRDGPGDFGPSFDPLDGLAGFRALSGQLRGLAEQASELLSLGHHAGTAVDVVFIWIRGACGVCLCAVRKRTLGGG